MRGRFLHGLLLVALIGISGSALRAQQQAMYTQYMFNGLAINPAYTGTHETMEFTALARDQWTGLEGAPNTQTFTMHGPLRNRSIGLGMMFIRDKIGVTSQNGVYGTYSYKLQFPNRGVLSMGLQAGLTFYNEDLAELLPYIKNQLDPNFTDSQVNEILPNFGAGLYYYTKRFYLGLSVPHLIRNRYYQIESTEFNSRQERHYLINSGIVVDLNRNLMLKPSTLIKYVSGAPVEVDLNLSLLIQKTVWIGASYRSFDSFNGLLQINLSDQLQVGYAYDFATVTDLSKVQGGSHELLLNFRIKPKRTRMLTPRYF